MDSDDSSCDLEAYEQNIEKTHDRLEAVQKKAFTKWVNHHLKRVNSRVGDLFVDLKDGHNLISLMEVLTAQSFLRETGTLRLHKLQNVNTALSYLKDNRKIRMVNIRNEDIVDGNPKLTLGLIWTVILHFQISEVLEPMQSTDENKNVSARSALLRWAAGATRGCADVEVKDFQDSWRDGRAFCHLVHNYRPDLIKIEEIEEKSATERLCVAFTVVEKEYGVTKILDPEDVVIPCPDDKTIMTYVATLYAVFCPNLPEEIQYTQSELTNNNQPVNGFVTAVVNNVGVKSEMELRLRKWENEVEVDELVANPSRTSDFEFYIFVIFVCVLVVLPYGWQWWKSIGM